MRLILIFQFLNLALSIRTKVSVDFKNSISNKRHVRRETIDTRGWNLRKKRDIDTKNEVKSVPKEEIKDEILLSESFEDMKNKFENVKNTLFFQKEKYTLDQHTDFVKTFSSQEPKVNDHSNFDISEKEVIQEVNKRLQRACIHSEKSCKLRKYIQHQKNIEHGLSDKIKQNMIDSFVADICFILLVLFSVFITLLNLQKLTSLFKRMHICGKIR